MPELRWTLLILGALFIGVLAFWEIRRKRHARGQDANAAPSRESERVTPTLDGGDAVARASAAEKPRGDARGLREPTLTFPDVHLDARGDRASMARPPVVEIDEASLADLKIEPQTVVDEFSTTDRSRASDEALGLIPTVPGAPGRSSPRDHEFPLHPTAPATSLRGTSSTGPRLAASGLARTPAVPDAQMQPRMEAADDSFDAFDEVIEPRADSADHVAYAGPVDSAEPADAADSAAGSHSRSNPSRREPSFAESDDALPVASSTADSEILGTAVVRRSSAPPLSPESFATPEPIVDWPDESTRKIIALRLVSGSGERFQGRAVRQALAAEGFQLGKFEIFHKPGPDARALLSVASLTKPGTFVLNTMDGQRYGGLSLFAVLPGPLSAVETFDELVLTARSLNDRLRGALQDERGEPLTPVRSASIRDSLASSMSPTPH